MNKTFVACLHYWNGSTWVPSTDAGGGAAGSTQVSISTGALRVYQSSAGDVNVTVVPASTVWAVQGPLTDAQLRATAVPVSGTFWQGTQPVSGPLTDAQLRASPVPVSAANSTAWQTSTTASGQAAAAGDNTILSSNSLGIYVYAQSVTPISTAAQLMRFLRGSTSEAWRFRVLAPSTVGAPGWGHHIAVSPPAYLFRTSTGQPLIFNVTSSGVSYSVAAWRE
mgnify:CR=1 FL=1